MTHVTLCVAQRAATVGGLEISALLFPKLPQLRMDAGQRRNKSLDCSRRTDNMTAQGRSTENIQCSCLCVCLLGETRSRIATCC